jgi:hypothetical protein
MDKLTTLARRLEPFIRNMIREMIGEMKSGQSAIDNKTYIHGTGFDRDDKTGDRGTNAVDLQLENVSDTKVAQGNYSAILAGQDNETTSTATNSVAAGYGAKVELPMAIGLGYYQLDYGDVQSYFVSLGDYETTPGSSWRVIASLDVPTDTLWTFSALYAVTEQGCAQSWSYRVEGAVENDGGTTSILAQTTTTIYEDDANWDAAVQADDSADELDFLIKDDGNSGKNVMCSVCVTMAQAQYAA